MGTRDLPPRLGRARAITDGLFDLVRPEALYDRPIPERHRLIFYLGHLEAFDRNLLMEGGAATDPLDRLFAFGIDPVDGHLPDDRAADWPAEEVVRSYALRTRALVDANGLPGVDPVRANAAIEHRLMHAETLAYALHRMPLEKLAPGPFAAGRPAPPDPRPVVEIPDGTATLGRPRGGEGFGWDNEYEEQVVDVPAFAIERRDVTNGRFLEFVRSGGYRDRSLWSREGWDWIRREGIEHPVSWRRGPNGWSLRAMFAEVPLPLDWPAFVSHAEATAYATWRGRRLPTEAQIHRAAFGAPAGPERAYPWGEAPPRAAHGVFGLRRWDPAPSGSHPRGDSAFGVSDLAGNGWEWTSTPFAPLPGFEPFDFYPGYSAGFFPHEGPNGTHYVMKGAGPRTATCFLRRSFRNWFQPLYPHVHATFRCVEG